MHVFTKVLPVALLVAILPAVSFAAAPASMLPGGGAVLQHGVQLAEDDVYDAPITPRKPVAKTICYNLTITTQDTSGAGTDANITMTLIYPNTKKTVALNQGISGNAFERGNEDHTTMCSKNALPNRILLTSDGWGAGSAWDVGDIEFYDYNNGQLLASYQFERTLSGGQTIAAGPR